MNKYIKISESNKQTSRIGFGCARLKTDCDLKESQKLIERCIESGITHFDTAPSYGTEKILGSIIGNDNNVTFTSKVGIKRAGEELEKSSIYKKIYKSSIKKIINTSPYLKNKAIKTFIKETDYRTRPKRKLCKNEILLELEITLKNLKRDKLDILLIHEPDQFFIDDELVNSLQEIKNDGYIDNFGLGYGRGDVDIAFNGILQQKYSVNDVLSKSKINIYHGVIRFLKSHGDANINYSEALKEILSSSEDIMVLFSTSNVDQIIDLNY